MRFIGIILSLLILAGTSALIWQDGLRGETLVIRASAPADLAKPVMPNA